MNTNCNVRSRRGIYRSRNGMIFGVCRGISDHFDFSAFWIRAAAVFFLTISFRWAIVVYFIAALFMKLEPAVALETDNDEEFYNSYANSSTLALGRLRRAYDSLNRRIQRMESVVTSKENDWERRLNS